ncbi:uncharacterized protein VTP21DRAFT_1154 [Calcarisporiella thermophila]|uniref:uncharacterized protein n=1 Tax=Calcarisporiella thermophila TaxID=911321 RepID=UPI00374288D5
MSQTYTSPLQGYRSPAYTPAFPRSNLRDGKTADAISPYDNANKSKSKIPVSQHYRTNPRDFTTSAENVEPKGTSQDSQPSFLARSPFDNSVTRRKRDLNSNIFLTPSQRARFNAENIGRTRLTATTSMDIKASTQSLDKSSKFLTRPPIDGRVETPEASEHETGLDDQSASRHQIELSITPAPVRPEKLFSRGEIASYESPLRSPSQLQESGDKVKSLEHFTPKERITQETPHSLLRRLSKLTSPRASDDTLDVPNTSDTRPSTFNNRIGLTASSHTITQSQPSTHEAITMEQSSPMMDRVLDATASDIFQTTLPAITEEDEAQVSTSYEEPSQLVPKQSTDVANHSLDEKDMEDLPSLHVPVPFPVPELDSRWNSTRTDISHTSAELDISKISPPRRVPMPSSNTTPVDQKSQTQGNKQVTSSLDFTPYKSKPQVESIFSPQQEDRNPSNDSEVVRQEVHRAEETRWQNLSEEMESMREEILKSNDELVSLKDKVISRVKKEDEIDRRLTQTLERVRKLKGEMEAKASSSPPSLPATTSSRRLVTVLVFLIIVEMLALVLLFGFSRARTDPYLDPYFDADPLIFPSRTRSVRPFTQMLQWMRRKSFQVLLWSAQDPLGFWTQNEQSLVPT